jgi:hypothetical protein
MLDNCYSLFGIAKFLTELTMSVSITVLRLAVGWERVDTSSVSSEVCDFCLEGILR